MYFYSTRPYAYIKQQNKIEALCSHSSVISLIPSPFLKVSLNIYTVQACMQYKLLNLTQKRISD